MDRPEWIGRDGSTIRPHRPQGNPSPPIHRRIFAGIRDKNSPTPPGTRPDFTTDVEAVIDPW